MPQRDATQRPFGGISDVFSELSRMRDVGTHGREHSQEARQRTHASAWVPVTDIVAQGDDLLIRLELAGVDPSDVHLGFSHGVLTVSGSRQSGLQDENPDNFYVRERFYGEFRRSFTLAETVEPGHITAEFENGLVEVVVRGGARASEDTRIEVKNRSSGTTTRTLG